MANGEQQDIAGDAPVPAKRLADIVWIRQFVGFAGVGVVGTAGHYATLIALVHLVGLVPLLASIAGFVVGAIINYFLNYRFIFRSRKRHSEALVKFLTVASAGLCLNALAVWLGMEWLRWHYLVAQVVATGIVLVWNFSANKIWTFAHRGDSR